MAGQNNNQLHGTGLLTSAWATHVGYCRLNKGLTNIMISLKYFLLPLFFLSTTDL